jgi:hypothetical protein
LPGGSRGLGDVYKRQPAKMVTISLALSNHAILLPRRFAGKVWISAT